jgi:hypothetical protein
MGAQQGEEGGLMSESFQPPQFNMAMLFLMQLNNRREEVAKASISGDYITWFRGCQEIWRSVKPKVQQLEEKKGENAIKHEEIDLLLGKVKEYLTKMYGNASAMSEAERRAYLGKSYTILDVELDTLYSKIMSILWQYDFIFPRRESYTLEEELEADLTGE